MGKDVEKLEHPDIAGGHVKWYNSFGKLSSIPEKIKYRVSL